MISVFLILLAVMYQPSCLMNYNDHVLHATTTILVGGDLSWSCRKKMVPKTKVVPKKKSRAKKKVVPKKSRAEKKNSCQSLTS